jgi:diguanylate cyclase (GGDEF)-like protein/PAS domain S-box-containing protein
MHKRFPDFQVTERSGGKLVPVAARDFYRVVDYVEPLAGNEAVFGFDSASFTDQNEALQRAVDTGLPSATNLTQLLLDKNGQRGFIVLMPIYRHGASLSDVEARRAAIIGDTAAVFRAHDLVENVLSIAGLNQDGYTNLSLYAGNVVDDAHLVFRKGNPPSSERTGGLLPKWLFSYHPDAVRGEFNVAGKTWTMLVSANPIPLTANGTASLLILIAGILMSAFAAAYVQAFVVRSNRTQRLVVQRTAELQQLNDRLKHDIDVRKRTEDALRLRERAIQASANAIIIISAQIPDFTIEYVNPAFERITGYAPDDVLGKSFRSLQSDDWDQPGIEVIRTALREQTEAHVTLRNYRKDGTMFWNEIYVAPVRDPEGAVTHFVVTQYDITSTKRYEAELEFQANRDVLTGLANRNLLRDRLRQAIAYAERYGHPVWVMFVDLDRFKFVNDTLGHRAGDLLLNKVAERLLIAVRETDTAARLGGDEFALILPERSDERLSMTVVQRIMDTLSTPLVVEGHEFFVTCSIGVAAYPEDGADADTLIKHAEVAMYRAKEMGRNNFQFYTSAMNAAAIERLHIEGNLRSAIERNEFLLHYQPQVDLHTGRIFGMEALIRWKHPELGMVPPVRFIGLAEDTGLIVPIGKWVTRTACMQNKVWQEAGMGPLRVAVNFSPRQFYQEDMVQSVAAILEESGLDPKHLEIELTESLVMTDVDRATGIMRDLKALGVQLSIDDFGTGYSSLSYLKRFPIDVLKIDQSFVRDITIDPDDAAIVVSIISLAHSLRLKVIAEGVETYEQLAFLTDHGCDQMQGYYFSRPVPKEDFTHLLEVDKRLPLRSDQEEEPLPLAVKQ